MNCIAKKKSLRILGTRGIPAAHGGFETFAEKLALYLHSRGWDVTVYCQKNDGKGIYEDTWHGVKRVNISVHRQGALGTIIFDIKSILHAAKYSDLVLTLGYNTAIFCSWFRLKGITNIINMDGIEWKRKKWGGFAKIWLYMNDWFGCWLGNHLIADHPMIKKHLETRISSKKCTMIPYGADVIEGSDFDILQQYDLEVYSYITLIARPEPENSVLEIVSGFSRKNRGIKLVVLGEYRNDNEYHKNVKNVASDEVLFLGGIYDKSILQALRYYCRAYIHGHQVGGTNPSLLEAMGAGNPVIAHDNLFNRWVTGSQAAYFQCADGFETV